VFEYPQNFDEEWGVNATGWAQAVTAGALYLSGGNFPLTNQVDFGTSFGIKVKSILTETASPSTSGYIQLAKTDTIGWRNNAGGGNLLLAVNGSDMLTFNGSALGLTSLSNNHIYVGNGSNVPTDVAMSGDATIVASGALTIANGAINNVKVASGAAIAVNKLASLTANRAILSDSSGFLLVSAVTTTELGYVSGVTSSIQTQLNAIAATTVPSGAMLDFAGTAAPSGWLLCDGSSYATAIYPALFAAIGYGWGGSGANFNVPSMTRRIGMGSGGSGTATIGNTVGNTGGAETHTLTQAELSTALGTASSSVTDPQHSHQVLGVNTTGGAVAVALNDTNSRSVSGFSAGTGAYEINSPPLGIPFINPSPTGITVNTTITNASGGNAHSIIQPAAIVLKIIKI